jgi:hypothetical protein
MLKVQYFKHPNIIHYLYDLFLATYGRLLWNEKVPHYFSRFIYVNFFENLNIDYTYLPYKYYSVEKSWTYNRRGSFWDPTLPPPPPPVVSHPPEVVSLPLDMDITSQVGRDVRVVVVDNLHSLCAGNDVGLNR